MVNGGCARPKPKVFQLIIVFNYFDDNYTQLLYLFACIIGDKHEQHVHIQI